MQRFNQDPPRKRKRRQPEKTDILREMEKSIAARYPFLKAFTLSHKDKMKSYAEYAREYEAAMDLYDMLTDGGKLLFPPNEESYVMERFKEDLEYYKLEPSAAVEAYCFALNTLYPEEEQELFRRADINRTYEAWQRPRYNTDKDLPPFKPGDKAVIVCRDMHHISYDEVTILEIGEITCTVSRQGVPYPYATRGLFVSREAAVDYMIKQAKGQIARAKRRLKQRREDDTNG